MDMYNKVEICGVNTATLPVLKSAETRALLEMARAGDAAAREKLIDESARKACQSLPAARLGDMVADAALEKLQNPIRVEHVMNMSCGLPYGHSSDGTPTGEALVAVDTIDEHFRLVGDSRLVRYGCFLLKHFFPRHDELCYEEGRLMKQFARGTREEKEDAARTLCAISGRMKKQREKYFDF